MESSHARRGTSIVLAVAVLCWSLVEAQRPAFEVASVRKLGSDVSAARRMSLNYHRGDTFSMAGTIGALVRLAYGIGPLYEKPYGVLEGEPDWDDRFHIEGKTQGPVKYERTTVGPIHLMMQSLLEERFGLNVHWETRERDGLALVLVSPNGSLGPQIRSSNVDCEAERARSAAAIAAGTAKRPVLGAPLERPACGLVAAPKSENGRDVPLTMELLIGAQPLSVLAENLSRSRGRPIVDRTGLLGNFDIELRYAPDSQLSARELLSDRELSAVPKLAEQSHPGWPRLDDALREQLGLKLEPAVVPIDVLVIDSVHPPTEN